MFVWVASADLSISFRFPVSLQNKMIYIFKGKGVDIEIWHFQVIRPFMEMFFLEPLIY